MSPFFSALREGVLATISRASFAALLVAATASSAADTLVGLVVGVHDGDSLTVLDAEKIQHKVRLSGIDAPERGQSWGLRSKEGLSSLAYRRQVEVEWNKRDRYGRVVGKVLVEGRDINLAQVASGLAWHYFEYADEQALPDRALYADAQVGAKQYRLGLWQEPSPTAPLDYRRAKRMGSQLQE